MENGATAHAVAVDLSSQGVVNLIMAWQAEGSPVPSLDAADALLQVEDPRSCKSGMSY